MLSKENGIQMIRGYCAQCNALCPTISVVKDGVFTRVLPDKDHPNATSLLCPKGLAGPELVYNDSRLKFPMRRTKPKGNSDPGWERISWDEALDIIADKLINIKNMHGAEAVAIDRSAPGGSAAREFNNLTIRLAYAFGSPNNIATTHICQWARDALSAYTFGVGFLDPEVDKSSCILIWGHNPYNTWLPLASRIESAIKKGAKLIVIDPRYTKLAEKADCWLQVFPGTDCALALGFLNVVITEKLYDKQFTESWTTAPFLVRSDTQNLLKANEVTVGGNPECYVIWDQNTQSAKNYNPHTLSYESNDVLPALTGSYSVTLRDRAQVECKTAFQLLSELVSQYDPKKVEEITRVPAEKLQQAARMFATIKPASYFTYTGIEQQINSSQTNRAICILYALTGNFDTIGSNRFFPRARTKLETGYEFLTPEIEKKRLGSGERPLGPSGTIHPLKASRAAIRPNDLYKAVLDSKPYPIKGLVAFGGNTVTANPESYLAREALEKLDFYVQTELFMTPSAQLADIVLPAASFWETWHVQVGFRFSEEGSRHVHLRMPVVSPQHESKSDIEIIFELAKRLGLADRFWNGDIEKAFNSQLEPIGITVQELRRHPGGITTEGISVSEKGYQKRNTKTGVLSGFNTPTRKVEIYCQLFKDYGYEPLPVYKELIEDNRNKPELSKEYPLTLTGFKLLEYCHGWGRCLPALRKSITEPYIEIHPSKAKELGIVENEWVSIETQNGRMRAKAKLTSTLFTDVVCTQHGWWQECLELGLPGYDPYSNEGSNMNLLSPSEISDSISGTYPLKGFLCRIKKLTG